MEDLSGLTTLPTDPFTGKPFVYRRSGAGFRLYSLGPDQQDDDGVSRDPSRKTYDIGWDQGGPPP